LYAFAGNGGVNQVDYLGLAPPVNPVFQQIHEGGQDALAASMQNPNQGVNNRGSLNEYCGLVCKRCSDGTLYRSKPVAGIGTNCWPQASPCEGNDRAVGIYHDHPHGGIDLSDRDRRTARQGFRTPSGRVIIPPNTPIGATVSTQHGPVTGIYDPNNASNPYSSIR